MTGRPQQTWSVDQIETWMIYRGRTDYRGPPIDCSDRVTWHETDGGIVNMSVVSYVRARDKWAARPGDWRR
jgi:hypothetical protein